jgi:hypothetical protein
MKLLNFRLYEQAGDNGSGGGGGTGGAATGGASGAATATASTSLLSGGGAASTAAGTGAGSAAQSTQATAAAGASTATVGEAWHVGLYGSDGKINATKFDSLPEHLKPHKDLFARYQTVEALMGGLANMSSLAGKKALAPLPENASPEAKAERSKLLAQINNVPEKPEGYGFKRPDNVPEAQWNQGYVDGIAGILHKHAISPAAAKELMDFDLAQAGQLNAGSKVAQEKAQAEYATAQNKALDEAFGAERSKHIDLAVRAIKTAGLDPNDAMFSDAKAVMLAAKFGAMISEDRLISGETNANAGMDDRAKALDIVNNPGNPLFKAYHEAEHPQHAQAVEAKSRLNQAWHSKQKTKS